MKDMTDMTGARSSEPGWGRRCARGLRRHALVLATVLGVVLGALAGLSVHFFRIRLGHDTLAWLKLPGELFLRMLNLAILPLVSSCIITGIATMDGKASGRMGLVVVTYALVTQTISVSLGTILTVAIHPGKDLGGGAHTITAQGSSYSDVFADFIRNMIPGNMVRAAIQTAYTVREETVRAEGGLHVINATNVTAYTNLTDVTAYINVTDVTAKLLYRDGINIIGIVAISIVFGLAIGAVGDKARPLLNMFRALNAVTFKTFNAIFWYSPVGIASLIAGAVAEVEDLSAALTSVGMFVVTVIAGQAVYQFVVAPALVAAILRVNPFRIHLAFLDAIMAACASSSGSVGLPFLIKDCTDKLLLDPRVVYFVQPIINATCWAGSAMFIVTANLFVAQTYGIKINTGEHFVLLILVVLLASAVTGVPSSSLVVIMMVAKALGHPMADRMGLLVLVDWFNDRVRVTTNIVGHGYGTVIVHHFCQRYMVKEEPDEAKLNPESSHGSQELEEAMPLKQDTKDSSLDMAA